jgi:hypothetical protein
MQCAWFSSLSQQNNLSRTQKQKAITRLDDGPGLPLISVLTSSSGLQPRNDQGAKQGDPDPDNDAGAPDICETEGCETEE